MSGWLRKCIASHESCSQTSEYHAVSDGVHPFLSDTIDLAKNKTYPAKTDMKLRTSSQSQQVLILDDESSSNSLHIHSSSSNSEVSDIVNFREQKFQLPTRVIDVGSDVIDPFLFVPQHHWGNWIALSHCVRVLFFLHPSTTFCFHSLAASLRHFIVFSMVTFFPFPLIVVSQPAELWNCFG